MENVTDIFQKYRECARHIRNIYYAPDDFGDENTSEDFDELAIVLFKHLIIGEFGINRNLISWLAEPASMFQIIPSGDSCPIMINRQGQSDYWDHPITEIRKDDLEMVFIDYFDWDDMDLVDFRYYWVRITASAAYPELVGFDALIATIYAEVYYRKEDESDNPA